MQNNPVLEKESKKKKKKYSSLEASKTARTQIKLAPIVL
jgi:hypothetical protein